VAQEYLPLGPPNHLESRRAGRLRTATGSVQAGTQWTGRFREEPKNRINKPNCRIHEDKVEVSCTTQNLVVREHRVGSSPNSGTKEFLQNPDLFPCRSALRGLHPSLGDSFGDNEP
jgi:hypothetical protein